MKIYFPCVRGEDRRRFKWGGRHKLKGHPLFPPEGNPPKKGGGKPRYRGFRFLRTCGAAGGVFCWLGFPNHPRCFFQIFLFFRPPRLQVDIFVDFSWAMVLLVAFWFFFGPPIFSLTVWFSCLFQVSCSFYFPDLRRRTSKFHPFFARNFLLNCFSYDFYPFFLIFP